MDFLKNISLNKKEKWFLLAGITAIAALIVLIILITGRFWGKEETAAVKDYDAAEQQIADSVRAYLSLYLELTDEEAAQAADAAVENYNIIMSSSVDVVNDSHTDIIKKRIREALIQIEEIKKLSEDELDGLTAGIAEIIWNAILSQIEESVVPEDYEQEYLYLAESIQAQMDALAEQKMKIHISARLKDADKGEDDDSIDAEALLAAIDTMTDDDLERLAAALGLSPEELQRLINANNLNLDKELEEKLAGLKKELSEELLQKYSNMYANANNGKTGTNGTAGQNGTNGKNGKDGTNGKDGKNGEDGANGKTTYIAYADDSDGTGFSLTPTETSKFVGTCITEADRQPTDYSSYSNWQIYRTYIITTTTDENNVTTVHIN